MLNEQTNRRLEVSLGEVHSCPGILNLERYKGQELTPGCSERSFLTQPPPS